MRDGIFRNPLQNNSSVWTKFLKKDERSLDLEDVIFCKSFFEAFLKNFEWHKENTVIAYVYGKKEKVIHWWPKKDDEGNKGFYFTFYNPV